MNSLNLSTLLLNPIETAKSELNPISKIGFIALSLLIGIPSFFIPHFIYFALKGRVSQNRTPDSKKTEGLAKKIFPEHHKLRHALILEGCSDDNSKAILPMKASEIAYLPSLPDISLREFFALHASSFGANSCLAGNVSGAHLSYLDQVIDTVKEGVNPQLKSLYQSIQYQIRSAKRLLTASFEDFEKQFTAEMRNAMQNNTSFLYAGGWTGIPSGHAIYLEFRPNQRTVRLYNLGAGAVFKSGLRYIPSFIEWKGVSGERLYSKQLPIALWELTHNLYLKGLYTPTNYQSADLYVSLEKFLQPQSIALSSQLKKKQPIGICEKYSLFNSYLASQLPLEEYKRLICLLRTSSVCNFKKNQFLGDADVDEACIVSLHKKSVKSTADYVSKQLIKQRISPALYFLVEQKLREVSTHFTKQTGPRFEQSDSFSYRPIRNSLLRDDPVHSFTLAKEGFHFNFKNPYLKELQVYQSVTSQKYTFDEILNTIKEGNKQAFHLTLLECCLKLPLTTEELSYLKNNVSLAQENIQCITAVALRYYNSLTSVKDPESIFIMTRLFHVQTLCAAIAYETELLPIFYPFHYADQLQKYFSTDPNIFHQQKIISEFFQFSPRSIPINFSIVHRPGSNEEAKKTILYEILTGHFAENWKAMLFKSENPSNLEFTLSCHVRELPPHLDLLLTIPALIDLLLLGIKPTPFHNALFIPLSAQGSNYITRQLGKAEEYVNEIWASPFIQKFKEFPSINLVLQSSTAKQIVESKQILKQTTSPVHKLFLAQDKLLFNEILGYLIENKSSLHSEEIQLLILHLFIEKRPKNYEKIDLFQLDALKTHCLQFLENIKNENNDVKIALFYLRLLRYLDPLSSNSLKLTLFYQNLLMTTKKDSESNLVFAHFLASLAEKKVLSQDELTLYLEAIFITSNAKFSFDPVLNKEILRAQILHSQNLIDYLKKNPDAINLFLRKKTPNYAKTWIYQQDECFVSSDHEDLFFPISAKWISGANKNLSQLPSDLLENPLFKHLFPTVTDAKFSYLANGERLYEFIDPKTQRSTQITRSCTIHQNIENYGWAELKPSDREGFTISHDLLYNYFHWIPLNASENKILFENSSTKKIEFHLLEKQEELYLYALTDHLILSSPSHRFSCIESSKYTHEWYSVSPSKLVRVDFPRLSLTLHYDEQTELFYLNHNPDLIVDLKAPKPIPHFSFGVKVFSKSSPKETWYLLPRFDFLKPFRHESLNPTSFEVSYNNTNHQRESRNYYLFKLDQQDKPFAKNQEETAYLALVYLIMQDYHSAEQYLKRLKGNLYNYQDFPKIKESLNAILNIDQIIGTNEPNIAYLASFAGWLLMENASTYLYQQDPSIQEKLIVRYKHAVEKWSHIVVHPFTLFEEMLFLSRNHEEELLKQRYFFLSHFPLESDADFISFSKFEENQNKENLRSILENSSKKLFNINNLLFTRPCFKENFHGYLQAILNPNTKEELIEEIEMRLCFEKNPEIASVILYALDHRTLKWEEMDTILQQTQYKRYQTPNVKALHQTPPASYFMQPYPASPSFDKSAFKIHFTHAQPAEKQKILHCLKEKKASAYNFKRLESYFDFPLAKKDSLIQYEINQRKNDLKVFKRLPLQKVYEVIDLKRLKLALKPSKNSLRLKELEKQLVEQANFGNGNEMLKIRGQIKSLSLADLIINFGQNAPEKLFLANPSLTQERIETLYQGVAEYLQLATEKQKWKRFKKAFAALENSQDPDTREDILQTLAEIALSDRLYQLNYLKPETLAYLVFEYHADLFLRKNQIELLERYLVSGEPHLIEQLIMGSGKSKVLLLLLALLRANGEQLSGLVVGEQFLNDIVSHVNPTLMEAFDKHLNLIHYDRSFTVNSENLTALLLRLVSIKKEKTCLIMTSKSLQSLLLSYVETRLKSFRNLHSSDENAMSVFEEIILFLKSEAKLHFDEVDLLLKVISTVSFDLDQKKTVDPTHLKVLEDLYLLIYTDQDIRAKIQVESDYQANPEAEVLNEKNYGLISHLLAEKFVDKLTYTRLNDPIIQAKRTALIHFISQNTELSLIEKRQANNAVTSLTKELQETILLAALEIGHLFKLTLLRPWNEKYGVIDDHLFAVPFKGANQPNKKSEYNPLVTANYTVQSHVKQGISLKVIKEQFLELIEIVYFNKQTSNKLHHGSLLKKWQDKLSHLNFTKMEDRDWMELQRFINQSQKNRIKFVFDFILPKQTYAEGKITATPQNMIYTALETSGFSGTLEGITTFHQRLNVKPDKGVESKSLALLATYSHEKAFIIDPTTPTSLLETIKNLPIQFDMICDAGAYFKIFENSLELAQELNRKFNRPILFYLKNQQKIYDGKLYSPHQYSGSQNKLTFLEQIATVGADTVQPPLAIAIITIGKDTTLNELMQAMWRARKVDRKQRVKLVISPLIDCLIRHKLELTKNDLITTKEIIQFCLVNSAEKRSSHNEIAYEQQFKAVVQNLMDDVRLSKRSTKETFEPFFKQLWIQTETIIPKLETLLLAKPLFNSKSLKNRYHFYKDLTLKIYKQDRRINHMPVLEELEQIYKFYLKEGMLSTYSKSTHYVDIDSEVIKETYKETETETDLCKKIYLPNPQMYEGMFLPHSGSYMDALFKGTAHRYISFKCYFKKYSAFKIFEQIAFSANFGKISNHKDEKVLYVKDFYLYDESQIFDYVVFENNHLIFLTDEDVSRLLKRDISDIYSLQSQKFITPDQKLTQNKQRLLLQAKFLTGVSHYDDAEIEILRTLFKKTHLKELKKVFEDLILHTPRKRSLYKTSPLKRLFEAMN